MQVDGAMDAANILKPALARGTLHCIGATTFPEYQRYIAADGALARRFQPVVVDEPTAAAARDILRGLQPRYEAHHCVEISAEAISAAVSCATLYCGDRKLPDSAIDLLDEAAAMCQMQLAPTAPSAPVSTPADRSIDDAMTPADASYVAPAAAPLAPQGSDRSEERIVRSSSDSPHNPTTSRPPLHPAYSASLNTLLSSPLQRSAPKPAAERFPKLCPHCGAAVTDAAKDVLLCPECRTRFLNMAVNKLMLGTTAVPLHKRPGFRAAAAQALQGPGTHSAGCYQDAISSAQGAGGTATASGDESSLQQAAASDRGHQNASVWPQVTAAEIFEIVATQQGMPLGQLTGEAGWYTQLQVKVEERVWGQGPAVRFADQLWTLWSPASPAAKRTDGLLLDAAR